MANLMTEGKPSRLILGFMWPVLMGNVFQQLYNVVDSVIVGRFLGVDALAAVGSTSSVIFLVWGLVMGLTSGFSVLISQKFGAGDLKGMRRCEGVSVTLCVGIAAVMTLGLMLGLDKILILMNTPDSIFSETRAYLGVLFAGIVITFAYNMLAGMLRALGDSKTPLYFLVLAAVLNIILDLVFIVVFGTGVSGAAYATLIAQFVSALLCILYIRKKYEILNMEKEDLAFSSSLAGRLLAMGIPMGLQFSITAIGTMTMQASLNKLGPTYIAGFSAGGKIQNIFSQTYVALGAAMATFVGQNFGAGKIKRIRQGVRTAVGLCVGLSIFSGVVVYGLSPSMMHIFVSGAQDEMISYGVRYLHTVVWFYPFLSLIFIYRNSLQGLGDGLVPMLGGVFELLARCAVVWILSSRMGYTGICLADPAAWIMALIPLVPVTYWRLGKLKRLESSEPA